MHQKDHQRPKRRLLTGPILEAQAKCATVEKTHQEIERMKEEFKQHPSEATHTEGNMFTKGIRHRKAHRASAGPLDGKSERVTEGPVCIREAQRFLHLSLYC